MKNVPEVAVLGGRAMGEIVRPVTAFVAGKDGRVFHRPSSSFRRAGTKRGSSLFVIIIRRGQGRKGQVVDRPPSSFRRGNGQKGRPLIIRDHHSAGERTEGPGLRSSVIIVPQRQWTEGPAFDHPRDHHCAGKRTEGAGSFDPAETRRPKTLPLPCPRNADKEGATPRFAAV